MPKDWAKSLKYLWNLGPEYVKPAEVDNPEPAPMITASAFSGQRPVP